MDNYTPSDPERWFRQNGLPIPPSFPTPAQAMQDANERSGQILSTYGTLQRILDRHEETLRKRWLKKTKKQQRSMLLKAWPNMASSHRPDFEALKREEPEDRAAGTRFRDWYLWPTINLEDLTLKKSLLHFLNCRGRNPPGSFAKSDFDATRLAHASQAIGLPFLPEHTMFLDGNTVAAYGRLVSWEDDEEAEEMAKSGRAFDPGAGLITLEIQQKLMLFLVKCCQAILHDLSDSAPLTGDYFPVKEALPRIIAEATEYPTMSNIVIERQYRVPANLDFQRLRALVAAKRSDAEDHIGALREDPGYFSDTLTDWSEHRREILLDTRGETHIVGPDKSQNNVLFWERVIANVIGDAYGSLIAWNVLHGQLNDLEQLKEKYSHAISPQRKLPSEYLNALLTFRQM
jgi:hypothetical protein